jgi:lipid-binding SYLF domain-containing protein
LIHKLRAASKLFKIIVLTKRKERKDMIKMGLLLIAVIGLMITVPPSIAEDTKEEERQEVRSMATKTLSRLYEIRPSAKAGIESAAGYGVFKNFGMKIFVAGGGKGKGVVVNNKTRQETFMKMVEVQAGLGMGVKKFSNIFVFENEQALNTFVDQGWEFGGQATAAAKVKDKGASFQGAVSVMPGVWMYQLTDAGIAAEITGKGTKYYKDKDLK